MAKTLAEYQQIFTTNIAYLIAYANTIGVKLTFGEADRTESQQLLYFYGAKLKEVAGKLMIKNDKIRSRTKNSNHLRRLAVDFNFFIEGQSVYHDELITRLGAFWESLDEYNRWGGNFENKDTPHFEMNIP